MNRYSERPTHDTSISWVRDLVFAGGKIFAGLKAHDYFTKNGPNARGWFSNKGILVQRVKDQMPFLYPLFEKQYTGKQTFGEVIAKRGVFSLPKHLHKDGKDEISRLQKPDFTSSYEAVSLLYKDPTKVMILDEALYLASKIILLRTNAGPCCYARWRLDRIEEIYFGSTGNPLDREGGHSNSSLPLARIWSFPTKQIAKAVEDGILDHLNPECVFTKTGEGWFMMKSGVNALIFVSKLMDEYYRWFMRNTGECQ